MRARADRDGASSRSGSTGRAADQLFDVPLAGAAQCRAGRRNLRHAARSAARRPPARSGRHEPSERRPALRFARRDTTYITASARRQAAAAQPQAAATGKSIRTAPRATSTSARRLCRRACACTHSPAASKRRKPCRLASAASTSPKGRLAPPASGARERHCRSAAASAESITGTTSKPTMSLQCEIHSSNSLGSSVSIS